jgi:hypothetical protein
MATKTWLGGIGTIGYNSGGPTEPTVGDIITGATSGASGAYISATITGGGWAGSDAAGVMMFRAISGTFTEDELLTNTTQSDADIATIDIATTPLVDLSGNFTTAENWDTAVVPADGDSLVFNGFATEVPASFADATLQTVGRKFSVTQLATIGYDSGSDEPDVGDILLGLTSGATARYVSTTLTGGTWGGGNAAGVLSLKSVKGTFTNDEIIQNTTQADVDVLTIDTGTAYVNPLDQSAKDFVSIIVSSSYTGNIGYQDTTTDVYVALLCAAGSVSFSGSGKMYLFSKHAAADIDSVVCAATGTITLGKADSSGQELITVTNAGGTVTILPAIAGTTAAPELDELFSVANAATNTIGEDNSSAVLLVRVILGTVLLKCSAAEINVSGGTLNIGASDFAPAATRTITKLLQFAGTVKIDMAVTISELRCFDGTLTTSGSGTKILGDAAINAGTIEVYDANVDLTGGAVGSVTLAANAEVKQLTNGSFNPPKQVNTTW